MSVVLETLINVAIKALATEATAARKTADICRHDSAVRLTRAERASRPEYAAAYAVRAEQAFALAGEWDAYAAALETPTDEMVSAKLDALFLESLTAALGQQVSTETAPADTELIAA